jgi:hypothetical protein
VLGIDALPDGRLRYLEVLEAVPEGLEAGVLVHS